MKKFLSLLLAFTFLGSMALVAQSTVPQNSKGVETHRHKSVHKATIPAAEKAEKMARELGLSADEQLRVKVFFEEQEAKLKAQHARIQKLKEEQIAIAETQRKAMQAELEKIIGAEKFQKFEAQRKMHRDKMKADKNQDEELKPQNHRQKMQEGREWEISPAKIAERLAQQLELSATEKANVQALFEKQAAVHAARKAEVKKFIEENKVRLDSARKVLDAEMEKIVGPEKFKKYASLRAEKKEKLKREIKKD